MIQHDDTIVAISTAAGKGGIGIIRISGEKALQLGMKIFKSKELENRVEEKRSYFGKIFDGKGDKIDHGYFTYYKKPQSFTGEDTVEISCHGSPQILKLILEANIQAGARLAEPGEFTMRAFLHGKMDLIQAEALRDLIDAKTAFQAKVAYYQMEGELSKKIDPIKESLIDLIAEAEASLDFPEEEENYISITKLQKESDSVLSALTMLAESFREGKAIREGATVAIIGAPNVGKSSIFNQLLKYDRAIVTELPGTTRDTLEEYVDLIGIPVRLVDTAGLREAKDIIEQEGVKRSRKTIERADIILYTLNQSRPLLDEEVEFFKECDPAATIIVINKTDLANKLRENLIPSQFANFKKVSAKFGDNISQLNELIRDMISHLGEDITGETIVTNVRHGGLLQSALESMKRASQSLKAVSSVEYSLSDMKKALNTIGNLTGGISMDDIYDRIFSKFCLGK